MQELRCPRAAHQPRAGEGLWEDEGRGCDGAPWGSWEHLGGVHTVGAFIFLLLELGGLSWAHLTRLWVLLGVTLQPLGFPSSLSLMFLFFFFFAGLAVHQIITITVSLIMVIAALITTLVLKNW